MPYPTSIAKTKLTGSTNGRGIVVVAVGTLGTLIHTSVSSALDGTYHEVYLYAQNNDTVDRTLTVEWGSAATGDNIIINVPTKAGLIIVAPGLLLANSLVITAFASAASVITIHGFVNAITT